MSAQTTYKNYQEPALAGMLHGTGPRDVVSMAAEGGDIPFGVVVSRGTDPDSQAVIGGTEFLGVTVRSLEREGDRNTGDVAYRENDTMSILRKDYIWVVAVSGSVPGAVVNYNTTTGVIDSGAPGAGEVLLPNGTFETTASAGELALIRIA